jgi:hypothetical protein
MHIQFITDLIAYNRLKCVETTIVIPCHEFFSSFGFFVICIDIVPFSKDVFYFFSIFR